MDLPKNARAVVIVAHPDDEVLWCGGLILQHPNWDWTIVSMCRASDPDRAPRFYRVARFLGAIGVMGDLDDSPEQTPLPIERVAETLTHLLPHASFALAVTHGPLGEYTRHRRHEECCEAVVMLWRDGRLATNQLYMCAYEDGKRSYMPRPRADASATLELPHDVLIAKKSLITEIYGFTRDSWESQAVPPTEAFHCFESPDDAAEMIEQMRRLP